MLLKCKWWLGITKANSLNNFQRKSLPVHWHSCSGKCIRYGKEVFLYLQIGSVASKAEAKKTTHNTKLGSETPIKASSTFTAQPFLAYHCKPESPMQHWIGKPMEMHLCCYFSLPSPCFPPQIKQRASQEVHSTCAWEGLTFPLLIGH